MKKILLIGLLVGFPLVCFAETLVLKSGKTVEGKIIEKTNEYVKIEVQGVLLTYFFDEIGSINSNTSISPLNKGEETVEKTPLLITRTNIYEDKEFGVRLVFPEGWFVISNKEKRKELQEKFEKLPNENVKEGFSEIQNSALGLIPIVTAYRYNPKSIDCFQNDQITVTITKTQEANELEYEKSLFPLAAKVNNGRIIEEPKEITSNGMRGICGTIESPIKQELRVRSSCIFVNGDKKYKISCDCKAKNFSALKEEFENVIKSFSIT
jgi:hypothetical protein